MTEAIYTGKQAKDIAGTKYPYGLGWHVDEVKAIESLKLRGGDASTLLPEWCEATGEDGNGHLVRKQRFEGKKPWDLKAHEAKIYAR